MAGVNLDAIVRMYVLSILCETFFFGAYTALLVFSIIFILYRRPPSRTRDILLALSVIMYSISTAHWALSIVHSAKFLRIGPAALTPVGTFIIVYLPTINFILSDGIVVWRAWVLWERRFLLFIPPLIFLVCTLGVTVASIIDFYESFRNPHSKILQILGMYFEWSTCGFTVVTNLWATGLIFIRAWQHRCALRSLCVKETFTSNAEKALAFLVESGALYLCLWIAYTSASFAMGRVFFFQSTIVQLVGMYPTVIVVVVTMQLSSADILSRPFADGPRLPIVFIPPSSSPQPLLPDDAGSLMETGSL
ncbi:hypothetical protein F5148DRAFT_1178552 [Russula earlei]|uniref:Uncharacterized protein n=1 Tax=Russula earlei TaxID=71964 RepID=A0ACC0UH28_9AGAM|nr:hypothetical protein F5148DRAFT_1178552 [Russula earlei]